MLKLTKQQQYGLLLTLYIARAGRCKVSDAAEQLGLSVDFLEQISRRLRLAGVLSSFRGPGGGYELLGEPTVAQVVLGLGQAPNNPYRMSRIPEKRALGQLLSSFNGAIAIILKRRVTSLNHELAVNESAAMVGLEENGTVN